nr:MAG: matrix protein [Wufeng shrew rhabdovirus 6]
MGQFVNKMLDEEAEGIIDEDPVTRYYKNLKEIMTEEESEEATVNDSLDVKTITWAKNNSLYHYSEHITITLKADDLMSISLAEQFQMWADIVEDASFNHPILKRSLSDMMIRTSSMIYDKDWTKTGWGGYRYVRTAIFNIVSEEDLPYEKMRQYKNYVSHHTLISVHCEVDYHIQRRESPPFGVQTNLAHTRLFADKVSPDGLTVYYTKKGTDEQQVNLLWKMIKKMSKFPVMEIAKTVKSSPKDALASKLYYQLFMDIS